MSTASVHSAALNNAVWCDAVCRAAGGVTRFAPGLWHNAVPSPAYYPNVITLEPSAGAGAVERALCAGAGLAIKDSFRTLDLEPLGFSLLFEARWICREPAPSDTLSPQLSWSTVETVSDLRAWEAAWWPEGQASAPRQVIFGPTLLDDERITLWAGHRGADLVAGAAVTETGEQVGIACTFFRGPDVERQRREMLAVLQTRHPGRTLLGYESGDELLAMRELGFRDIGPLCVWLGQAPSLRRRSMQGSGCGV
jgi:hypothetical protein